MKPIKICLTRFLDAQENSYVNAISELRAGKKQSHWIWYVFPQLKGLGQSYNSNFFGLSGLAEARAYLADPVLGYRLQESIKTMLMHSQNDAALVLGEIDALKFKSCLTLFSLAEPSEKLFVKALDYFYDGARDKKTIALLQSLGEFLPKKY